LKKILLFLIMIISLNAETIDGRFLLYDMDNLQKQFIQEYQDKKLALKYVKALKNNSFFKRALSDLRNNAKIKEIHRFNNKNYIIRRPDYPKFFNRMLKLKENPYASFLAVNLIMVAYGNSSDKINKTYLLPFSEQLYLHKMCLGYLFYGDMQRVFDKNFGFAKQIYEKGKYNCTIPFLRTQIIGRELKYY